MKKQSDGTEARSHVVSPEQDWQTLCGGYSDVLTEPLWRDANCVPCRMAAAPSTLDRIYVAGPISGDPSRTFEEKAAAFERAAALLDEHGYVGVPATYVDPSCGLSPAECVASQRHEMVSQGQGKHSWECYMRSDLRALLSCDGVALLPAWELSPGARVEFNTAVSVNLPARPLDWWLAQRPPLVEPTRYCATCRASEDSHAPGGSRYGHHPFVPEGLTPPVRTTSPEFEDALDRLRGMLPADLSVGLTGDQQDIKRLLDAADTLPTVRVKSDG